MDVWLFSANNHPYLCLNSENSFKWRCVCNCPKLSSCTHTHLYCICTEMNLTRGAQCLTVHVTLLPVTNLAAFQQDGLCQCYPQYANNNYELWFEIQFTLYACETVLFGVWTLRKQPEQSWNSLFLESASLRLTRIFGECRLPVPLRTPRGCCQKCVPPLAATALAV